jgi:glyoxylase-like metal-dependent hydrolase (beta-lactamase superfamily II)
VIAGRQATDPADDGRLTRLTPSLWWYRDTCNVYLWTAGSQGLLVDLGSGGILDRLEETGVREIVAVAHTHHHRDQCGGDERAEALGIPIWVPARERALFEATDAFWRLRRTYDSYDASSLGFTRATPVPVARGLLDHERLEWAGGTVEVLPTPGHTKGSISLLATVDGTDIAFTGDLIAGPGTVPTLHDLQWQYGMPDAVGAALHSTVSLAKRGPDVLLPSHGRPLDGAGAALRELTANLRRLAGLLGEMRRNRVWTTWPSSVDQPIAEVLPGVWANTHSLANTYALVDERGDALILDYGYPSWDHFYADQRFVAHTLDDFREQAGLQRVVATIPSHYHDDHLAGVPWLQREHGAQAWIHASFAEIVATPERFDLPCLLAEPIRVDRVLADGDEVVHGEARLEAFHMPGHTTFALGLGGTIGGRRVAYTGDNLLAGSLSPLRAAAPIYRNVMRLDSIRVGVERLLAFEPEVLLTGHTGALEVTRQDLDEFLAWARELELAVSRLTPVPGLENEALDPYLARFDPYRADVAAGGSLRTRVLVANHAATPRPATVRLRLPAGWSVSPHDADLVVPAGATGSAEFVVGIPPGARPGRVVITADVELGGTPRGELAESLLEVLPGDALPG